jgi:hypothetical protein
MADETAPTAPRRSRVPRWLYEGVDLVQQRQRALLISFGVVVAIAGVVTIVAPDVLPPTPLVGAAIGIAGLLLALAVLIALDTASLKVRGPRHIRAAGGELVAVLPSEPSSDAAADLARAIEEVRPSDRTLLLGVAAATGDGKRVGRWAQVVARCLAERGTSVLSLDLTADGGNRPGFLEVVRHGYKLGDVVEMDPEVRLATLGPGRDNTEALRAFNEAGRWIPRDLEVLIVAMPMAASRAVVRASLSLDQVLIVAERDRTSRVELIAGLDATEAVGTHSQVILIDDTYARYLGIGAPAPAAEVSAAPDAAPPMTEPPIPEDPVFDPPVAEDSTAATEVADEPPEPEVAEGPVEPVLADEHVEPGSAEESSEPEVWEEPVGEQPQVERPVLDDETMDPFGPPPYVAHVGADEPEDADLHDTDRGEPEVAPVIDVAAEDQDAPDAPAADEDDEASFEDEGTGARDVDVMLGAAAATALADITAYADEPEEPAPDRESESAADDGPETQRDVAPDTQPDVEPEAQPEADADTPRERTELTVRIHQTEPIEEDVDTLEVERPSDQPAQPAQEPTGPAEPVDVGDVHPSPQIDVEEDSDEDLLNTTARLSLLMDEMVERGSDSPRDGT